MTLNQAHKEKINIACYMNKNQNEACNLIASACDSGIIKLWDKRTMNDNKNFAGAFIGHSEGITHIEPRDDGAYFVSNSKDQLIKLWDVRMMLSPDTFSKSVLPKCTKFDFSAQDYP